MKLSHLKRKLTGLLVICVAMVSAATLYEMSETSATAQVNGPYYVQSPVYGGWSGDEKWYDAPGSPAHIAYSLFDDTNAYDLNLPGDRDKGLPVYAAGAGKVISLGTTYPGTLAGGNFGAVLIDHQNGTATGYMHMRNITVQVGASVTSSTIIGYISNKSSDTIPNHLHFAYYVKIKKNNKDYFSSVRAYIAPRDFSLSLPSSVTVRRGATFQISASVPFPGITSRVEDARWFDNTFWTSNKTGTATVSGNGLVKGVTVGSATITLKFSGKIWTVPVNVIN